MSYLPVAEIVRNLMRVIEFVVAVQPSCLGYNRYDVENAGVDDYFVDPKFWRGTDVPEEALSRVRSRLSWLSIVIMKHALVNTLLGY